MPAPVIGVSGVRGVVGTSLNPEDVARWGAAFGMLHRGRVLVGRDTRSSGPMFVAAVTAGLQSVGVDVADLGICPTPTVQLAVPERRAGGGIVVTASHNPPEWNALKFIGADGRFLAAEEISRLEELFKRSDFIERVPSDDVGGLYREEDAVARHIERVLALEVVDVRAVRSSSFTVALDACNGAGSAAAPALLEALGCRLRPINCELQAPFPRGPEPVAENLKALENEVKASGADVGFALDPDGDRLALVTEAGRAPGEEYTLPICATHVLSRRAGAVGTNLSTSAMIEDVARRFECDVFRAPVGEANVVSLMARRSCVFGGEGNGGVILPELHYGRDSLVAMALVLTAMAASGSPLSALCRSLPDYHMIKRKVPRGSLSLEELKSRLRSLWDGAQIDERDGIRATWEGAWIHVRPSGTEPVIRVIAEARDPDQAALLVRQACNAVAG